jgi:glycosyltransferase involved in cell wall biosynthesis
MNQNSKFSILIPVFNRELFIGAAIESVLNQTYGDFEIIISDNCSSDDTVGVINKYSIIDNRIKLYKQNENIGMWNNFNFLISKANGDYIKILCSDDTINADALQHEVSIFESDRSINLVMGRGEVNGSSWFSQKNLGSYLPINKKLSCDYVARQFIQKITSCGVNVFNYPAGISVRRQNSNNVPLFVGTWGDVADILWFLGCIGSGYMVCHDRLTNVISSGLHQQGVRSLSEEGRKSREMAILINEIINTKTNGEVRFCQKKFRNLERFYKLKESLYLFNDDKGVFFNGSNILNCLELMPFLVSRFFFEIRSKLKNR